MNQGVCCQAQVRSHPRMLPPQPHYSLETLHYCARSGPSPQVSTAIEHATLRVKVQPGATKGRNIGYGLEDLTLQGSLDGQPGLHAPGAARTLVPYLAILLSGQLGWLPEQFLIYRSRPPD